MGIVNMMIVPTTCSFSLGVVVPMPTSAVSVINRASAKLNPSSSDILTLNPGGPALLLIDILIFVSTQKPSSRSIVKPAMPTWLMCNADCGVVVPMPTLPVKLALPVTVSLLAGVVVPMPTLPLSVIKKCVGVPESQRSSH